MNLPKLVVSSFAFVSVVVFTGASVFALLNEETFAPIHSEAKPSQSTSTVSASVGVQAVVPVAIGETKARLKVDDPVSRSRVDKIYKSETAEPVIEEHLPEQDVVLIENEPVGSTDQTPVAVSAVSLVDALETRFETEQYDPAWNDPLQAPLRRVFGETSRFAGNELVDARCQSTLCRVEVRHHEASARDQLLLSIAGQAGSFPADINEFFDYEIDAADSIDGLARTIVFVARPGHGLGSQPLN